MTTRPTLRELHASARARLAAAGIERAEMETRRLLEFATGVGRLELMEWRHRPLPVEAIVAFQALVARRVRREPFAYILGEREFWSLSFRVGPGALIPRPDSETVVEAALAAAPVVDAPLRVLDIGVGSGCLLLSVLAERPRATGIGTDASAAALRWARENAEALGSAGRVQLVQGDLEAGVPGRFDLILCNPPYVPTGELADLAPELAFEPRAALDGGADGLDVYRRLLPRLAALLAPAGVAVLEHGAGQEAAIAGLARAAGLGVESLRDLAGRPRVAVLRAVSAAADA